MTTEDPIIHYVAFLHEPASATDHRSEHGYLIAHFGGLQHGTMPGHNLNQPDPFLALTLPGDPLTFEYTDQRDEWIATFECQNLRPGRRAPFVAIREGNTWLEIPRMVPLNPTQVAAWRKEGRHMHAAHIRPTPGNRLRLKLGFLHALRFLWDHQVDYLATTPAGQLMALLGDSAHFRTSIPTLSHRCGYAPDYLSAVFKREYHLSPVAYRNAVRIRIGKDLILTTDLPIARIARQLGFKQLTHFSGLFRKTFGISAREVQCQSRANKP